MEHAPSQWIYRNLTPWRIHASFGPDRQLEVFDQNPDLEYFKAFFRPENKWPARMFGTFAKPIKDARLSDLRSYAYFVVPVTKRLRSLARNTAAPAQSSTCPGRGSGVWVT